MPAAGYDDNTDVLSCGLRALRRRGRAALPAAVALMAALATGCASSGAVPRPRPFPGASLPPTDAPVTPDSPAPPVASPIAPPALVATALAYRGTPYRNGGSDPSGFDCSGFVQWVYARHGTRLPREVRDQFLAGEEIEMDDVLPGDLVFFETVAKGASHVGIALGNGEFVHAPSSRGVVRVERYTGSYWGPRLLGARRVAPLIATNAPRSANRP
jgi:cell wall-associated NlpC family hydrolase